MRWISNGGCIRQNFRVVHRFYRLPLLFTCAGVCALKFREVKYNTPNWIVALIFDSFRDVSTLMCPLPLEYDPFAPFSTIRFIVVPMLVDRFFLSCDN